LVVEGAAFYTTVFDYAGAATLGTTFADLTFALDGHYVTALFAPTEGSFDADRMGGGVEVTFAASEDVSLKVGYDYDQTIAGVAVTSEVSGEVGLIFSDIDVTLTGGYDLLTTAVPAGVVLVYDKAKIDVSSDDVTATPLDYLAYAEYIGYALTDDITFDLTYQYDSAVVEHTATAALNYTYSDVLGVVLEGRYDTVPTGPLPYSAELTLTHALATNTELVVGYEYNDWDADDRDILDDVGTLSAVLSVSF
jgi:long-subunit fatty acid transport protein